MIYAAFQTWSNGTIQKSATYYGEGALNFIEAHNNSNNTYATLHVCSTEKEYRDLLFSHELITIKEYIHMKVEEVMWGISGIRYWNTSIEEGEINGAKCYSVEVSYYAGNGNELYTFEVIPSEIEGKYVIL